MLTIEDLLSVTTNDRNDLAARIAKGEVTGPESIRMLLLIHAVVEARRQIEQIQHLSGQQAIQRGTHLAIEIRGPHADQTNTNS